MMRKKHKKNISGKDSERFGKIRLISNKKLIYSVLNLICAAALFLFYSCESAYEVENIAQIKTEEFVLNEKVCTDFAIKLHTSLANGDTSFINSYLDWKTISNSIAQDAAYWNDDKVEIFKAWKSKISIGQDLIGELVIGNHLRFITYYQLNGEHFIILRNYVEPQTVNYFEFRLISIGSAIAIADVYDFNKSMLLSEMGKEFCDYYSACKSDWKIIKGEIENKELEIEKSVANGDLKLAYSQLTEFETTYQKTFMWNNLKEFILLKSENKTIATNYLFEKSQMIDLDEKGRSLTLFYLNAYVGNYNDAIIAIANLESAVGEDGVLEYLKGNLYFELGEMDNALEAFNNSLAFDNEIFSFHIAKVKTLIEQTLYLEAVESLLVMDDSFVINDLAWDAEFMEHPAFLNSEEYQSWKQRLNE
jgi:hypothetical protein